MTVVDVLKVWLQSPCRWLRYGQPYLEIAMDYGTFRGEEMRWAGLDVKGGDNDSLIGVSKSET